MSPVNALHLKNMLLMDTLFMSKYGLRTPNLRFLDTVEGSKELEQSLHERNLLGARARKISYSINRKAKMPNNTGKFINWLVGQ